MTLASLKYWFTALRRLVRCPMGLLYLRAALLVMLFNLMVTPTGWAADVEILTPRPGSTIMARHPGAHLVLRLAAGIEPRQVRVKSAFDVVLSTVDEEVDGIHYLHFRLPLVAGKNQFTILPGNQTLEVNYQAISAGLPTSIEKAYLFHQDDRLPDECSSCHELGDVQLNESLGCESQESCTTCHQDLTEAKFRHEPVVDNRCLTCHRLSQDPLRIGFPTGKIAPTCFTCHTERADWLNRRFIHGPVIVGGCTLCHDPHGGDQPYFVWAEGSRDLCLACHSDKDNLINPQSRLSYVHGVIPGRGCVICHDPHATDNPAILKLPINPLCFSCHPRLADLATIGHPVSGHPVTAARELRRPNRKLSCAGCHDPHGSEYPYMLIADPLDGIICAGCHKR